MESKVASWWDGETNFNLPVRQPLVVASIVSGRSYSLAPLSALNPVAGTSYSNRSYRTSNPAVTGYMPGMRPLAIAGDHLSRTILPRR